MSASTRWSVSNAWNWYQRRPWLCGFNYLPSTAVNFIELWRSRTFDPATIQREMNLAAAAGMNTCRVNLSFDLWKAEPEVHLRNLGRFLEMADAAGISAMLCLFDDCGHLEPFAGPQPDPIPGVHNSQQASCPSHGVVRDGRQWGKLEQYVKAFVSRFGSDPRVLCWDVYNEPGHGKLGRASLPLLIAAFEWTRECRPLQPLTAGLWHEELKELNHIMLSMSDVVSFHSYGTLADVCRFVEALESEERPILCTEWLARGLESRVETHLPFFHDHRMACYCRGLVNGRAQTHLPWGHLHDAGGEWFHDLFHANGSPYSREEIRLFSSIARSSVPVS